MKDISASDRKIRPYSIQTDLTESKLTKNSSAEHNEQLRDPVKSSHTGLNVYAPMMQPHQNKN